jgi:hypothetical protein
VIDLTGANLTGYLIRVAKDAVTRNPRFRNTLGEITFASNNQINWGDAQVTMKSVTTSGNRLSPDYFMCTQHGRAILCQVGDKDGAFVEWVTENDKTRLTPAAGTYYFNVDAVNEQTREVNLTVQQYRWEQGKLQDAEGTKIGLRPGLDGTTLTVGDVAFPLAIINSQAYEKFIYLLSPVQQIGLKQGVTALTPNTDFWIERSQSTVIIDSTRGGVQVISIPPNYLTLKIVDQDGYELRKDVDYAFQGPNFIVVSQYTPPAQTLTAVGVFKLDPTTTLPATNPENVIVLNIGPNETLAPGQVTVSATSGDYNSVAPDANGNLQLPVLLLPGEYVRWEARILTANYTVVGKKYELNGFKKTVWDPKGGAPNANEPGPGAFVVQLDPATQRPIDPIPGMVLAIGDSVVVGDQCAVIVNPDITETYEVFGSKENLSFVLECKANDYQTASDISELLKRELLVLGRQNMEADGITIFEATRDTQGEQRDPSGTAPRYMFNVTVTASADWKVFVPCVTRLVSYEINEATYVDGYAGKINMAPRLQAFGAFQFIPAYA